MSQLWHSEQDMQYRKSILLEIYKLFERSSEVSRSLEWKQSFPSFVRRLELVLYLCGSSLEEYADPTTVVKRLRSVAEHLDTQRVQQQQQLAEIEQGAQAQAPVQDALLSERFEIQPQATTMWTDEGNVPLQQYIIRQLGSDIPGLQTGVEGGMGGAPPGNPETIVLKQEDLLDSLGRAVPQGYLQQQAPQLDQLYVQNASGQLVSLTSLGEGTSDMGQNLQQQSMQTASVGGEPTQMGTLEGQGEVPSFIVPAGQVSFLRGGTAENDPHTIPRIVLEGEPGARYYSLEASQGNQGVQLVQVAPQDIQGVTSEGPSHSWPHQQVEGMGGISAPAALNDMLVPALNVNELQPALSPEYVELLRTLGSRGGGTDAPPQ